MNTSSTISFLGLARGLPCSRSRRWLDRQWGQISATSPALVSYLLIAGAFRHIFRLCSLSLLLCRGDTHSRNGLDFGHIQQNQSWPIALASRRGPHYTCPLTLGGTREPLKRSMGTTQKENIDLQNIKTVFNGS
jgi:hypothetical protein